MKILVIEDEEFLRDTIGLYLEAEFGAQVSFAGSASEAKELLRERSDFTAIISDYDLGDGTGEDVFRDLRSRKVMIPFILSSSYARDAIPFFSDRALQAFIPKADLFDRLRGVLEASGAVKGLPPELQGGDPDFCRFRTATLLRMGALGCDLFLKLAEGRFVRVLREGDCFEDQDFQRFADKKVEYLYVRSKDRGKLYQKLLEDLQQGAEKPEVSAEEFLDTSVQALDTVVSLVERFGFTPEVQQITKANVALAIKTFQKSDVLNELFERLLIQPDRYLASHSVALAAASCGIASVMEWKSDATFYKLSLASFLHDILLTNQELAELQSLEQLYLKTGKFTTEEIQSFLNHPKACSELVRKMDEIPPDVDLIILQHHERPDESGFPGHLGGASISPLSAVFILAHELLCFDYRNPGRANDGRVIHEFVKRLPASYQKGRFRALIDALVERYPK